jgi:Kdo-III transferase WaaZ
MRDFPVGVKLQEQQDGSWRVHPPRSVATLASIERIKATHDGRCLIVASGQSAKGFDYSALPENTFIIAVNGAPVILDEVNCDYHGYVATDPDFFEHRMPIVTNAVGKAKLSCLSFLGIGRIAATNPRLLSKNGRKIHLIEPVNRQYLLPRKEDRDLQAMLEKHPDMTSANISGFSRERVGWSSDIRSGVFTARTVTYTAFQVARYMGFSKIGFIGADFTDGGRAYNEGESPRPSKLATDFDGIISQAFEIGITKCKNDGVGLYNLSPDSRLSELGLDPTGALHAFQSESNLHATTDATLQA